MGRRPLLPSVLAVLALVLAACGGGASTPLDALASAFDRTGDTSFSWELTLDLDQESLATLSGTDPGAAQGLAMAQSLRVSGVSHGDEASSMAVEAMGFRIVEMRAFGNSDVYVQVNVASLAALAGSQASGDQLLEEFGLGGFEGRAKEIATTVVNGGWVGVTGMTEEWAEQQKERQKEQMAEVGGVQPDFAELESLMEDLTETYLDDIRSTFEDFTTITQAGEGEVGTRYDVRFALHTFLRDVFPRIEQAAAAMDAGDELTQEDLEDAIAESPESLGGLSIDVADGLIHRAVFDVGAFLADIPDAQEAGIAPGAARVLISLSAHGEAPALERPADALTITADELTAVLDEVSEQMESAMDPFAGAADVDVRAEVRNIAVLQETFFTDNARYAETYEELASVGFVASDAAFYGLCTYDLGYAISVSDFAGNEAYYDSQDGEVTEDDTSLTCYPELQFTG